MAFIPIIEFTPRIIQLDQDDQDLARKLGIERHKNGEFSTDPASGHDGLRDDIVGALGEIAVARHYGVDTSDVEKVLTKRPGAIADLRIADYNVSVKSTEYWSGTLTLFVGDYDRNDIHILVSVELETGRCGLQGWAKREDLARYPPTKKEGRKGLRHNIPAQELRVCKEKHHEPDGNPEGDGTGGVSQLRQHAGAAD